MRSTLDLRTQPSSLAGNMAVAKLVGYLALIDLLFLPYLQLIILPLSLPLICLAIVVLDTRVRTDNYVALLAPLAASATLSVAVSYVLSSTDENLIENFKRLIQLLSSFVYFFYFRWLASRVPMHVSRIAGVFICWFGILSIAFLLRPEQTGEFMRVVYGRLVTSEETLAMHLRFAYMFTDPNGAAYFLLIAAAPLLMSRRSLPSLGFAALVVGVLTFLTQSRGALAALLFMIITIVYPLPKLLQTVLSARRAMAVLLAISTLVGVVVYLRFTAQEATDVIKLAYERIFEAEDYASGGSRFEIWSRLISYYWPMPLGRGYVLEMNGVIQRPHSDLLRMVYAYGLIAAVPMLWFLFSRIGKFTPLILPALAAFLINTLIDEQKLFALFLSMLALYIGAEEREARERARRGREIDALEASTGMPPPRLDGQSPPTPQTS